MKIPLSYKLNKTTQKDRHLKSGTTDRSVDGKNYTDMTEKDVAELFVKFDVDVLETWVSCDPLSRGNEWINVIVKKF